MKDNRDFCFNCLRKKDARFLRLIRIIRGNGTKTDARLVCERCRIVLERHRPIEIVEGRTP